MKKMTRTLLAMSSAALAAFGTLTPAHAIEVSNQTRNNTLVCGNTLNNDEWIAISRLRNFEISFNVFNGIKDRLNQQNTRDAFVRYVDAMLALTAKQGWNPDTEAEYNLAEWNALYDGTFGKNNAGYVAAASTQTAPGISTLHFNSLLRNPPAYSIGYGANDWHEGNPISTDLINHQAYVTMLGRDYVLPNDDDRNILAPQHQVYKDICDTLAATKTTTRRATLALNPRLMLWTNNDYAYWRNLLLARDMLVAAGRPTTLVDGLIARVDATARKLEADADAARVDYDANIDKQRWFTDGAPSVNAEGLANLSSQFPLSSSR
ncbi:MAG: hypothetical protein Q3962_07990 [Corynebacterium sp.]|nr:hypothetical protein [Corynebacterium sp.]